MKQFRFEYKDKEIFTKQLSDLKKQCDADKMTASLFQIYSEVLEEEVLRNVCDVMEQFFPDTPYTGCSTSGNIIDCELRVTSQLSARFLNFPLRRLNCFNMIWPKNLWMILPPQSWKKRRKIHG